LRLGSSLELHTNTVNKLSLEIVQGAIKKTIFAAISER
jgi:hypothetical protein